MILIQKSRNQLYSKAKMGKYLKFKDVSWLHQNITHLWGLIAFLLSCLPGNHIEKAPHTKSVLPPSTYETSLDTSSPQKSVSLHCKQINRVKDEVDGQPSLLACMQVSDYKAAFTPMHLVFLELDTLSHEFPKDILSSAIK